MNKVIKINGELKVCGDLMSLVISKYFQRVIPTLWFKAESNGKR